MHKLTANQQAGAWELLRKRRVAYITGDAQGCTGRVESRSDPGRWYEVQIGTDRRGLWFRCECQFNEHRPSRMCTHIAALWIVWQAVNPTGGRHEH